MILSQVPPPPWLPDPVNRAILQVKFPQAAPSEVAHWMYSCRRLIVAVKCISRVNWLNYIRSSQCRCSAVSESSSHLYYTLVLFVQNFVLQELSTYKRNFLREIYYLKKRPWYYRRWNKIRMLQWNFISNFYTFEHFPCIIKKQLF